MNFSVILLAYFSTFVILAKCNGPYPTLTFDIRMHALINLSGKIETGNAIMAESYIALACPAETPLEETFNSISLSKNSLFVKYTYDVGIYLSAAYSKICQNRYKMSICYQRSSEEILYGYEVYYENRTFVGIQNDNSYSDFDNIINAFSQRPLTTVLKPKLELVREKPLGFIWISSFRLRFDNKLKRPKQVIYRVSKATEIGVTCENYDLGKEIYEKEKIDLNSLYENQSKIFENVVIPEPADEIQNKFCVPEKQCFTKWSLIPPEEFRFRYPEPKNISCSDLTTVPIWKSILEEDLRKADRFLYALSRVIQGDLQVTAGVHGNLKLSEISGKIKTINLGNDGQIAVPRIIYKIVTYDVLIHDMNDTNAKITPVTKAIIILIQNNPNIDTNSVLCSKENCENWGWKEMLYQYAPPMGSGSRNVFCCARNEETLKNLGIKFEGEGNGILNLRHFPVYDPKLGTTNYRNIVQNVSDEMDRLFGDKNDSNDDHVGDISKGKNKRYRLENIEDKAETSSKQGELSSSFDSSSIESDVEENQKIEGAPENE